MIKQPLSFSFLLILSSSLCLLCSTERADHRLRLPEASEGHPAASRGPRAAAKGTETICITSRTFHLTLSLDDGSVSFFRMTDPAALTEIKPAAAIKAEAHRDVHTKHKEQNNLVFTFCLFVLCYFYISEQIMCFQTSCGVFVSTSSRPRRVCELLNLR